MFLELTAGHAPNHVLYRILLAGTAEPRLCFRLFSLSFSPLDITRFMSKVGASFLLLAVIGGLAVAMRTAC